MLDFITNILTQKFSFYTGLTIEEIRIRISDLLAETMLFGDKRYEGYFIDSKFQIKDTFVTKIKTPPQVDGYVSSASESTEVHFSLKPTKGIILRFLLSVLVFFFVFFTYSNDSIKEPTIILQKIAFSFLAFLVWNLIILANYRSSSNRARKNLEEILGLKKVDNIL